MKLNEAKSLLIHVDRSWDRKNREMNGKTLTPLFVPALWGNGIVPRDSLRGRLSLLLNGRPQKTKLAKQITNQLAQALAVLNRDKKGVYGVSLATRVALHRLVQKNPEYHNDSSAGQFGSAGAEDLHAFTEATTQRKVLSTEELQRTSLLSQERTLPFPISSDTLQHLFSQEGKIGEWGIPFFDQYFAYHPEHIDGTFSGKLEALKNGHAYTKGIRERFFPHGVSLPEVKAAELRMKVASEMAEAAAKGNWMYCAGFGKQRTPLAKLTALVNKLPAEIISDFYSDENSPGQLPSPEQFVEKLLKSQFEELELKLQAYGKQVPASFAVLMQDGKRQLPEGKARQWMGPLTAEIESWMKQGMIGNIMEFFPDGEIRELLLSISHEETFLTSKEARKELYSKWTGQLMTKFLDGSIVDLNTPAYSLMDMAQGKLPSAFLRALGLDGIATAGEVWIATERQPDGRCTVKVYGNGDALTSHPAFGTETVWPLVIRNVDPANLSSHFFERLLYFDIAPLTDGSKFVSPKDFYEGVIGSLGGDRSLMHGERTREMAIYPSTESHLATHFLTDAGLSYTQFLFKARTEALITYCKPLFQEGRLVIKDGATADLLAYAVDTLLSDPEASGEELKSLEAAKAQILDGISRFHTTIEVKPTSVIPDSLVEMLKAVLTAAGISMKMVRRIQEPLELALGEEFGDLLDKVIEKWETTPVAPTTEIPAVPAVRSPRGAIGSLLYHAYFSIMIKAIIYAYHLWQISTLIHRKGIRYLGAPFAAAVLSRVMPRHLKNWLANVSATLNRQLSELMTQIILRTIFSKKQAQSVKELAVYLKKGGDYVSRTLTGREQVTYEADGILPIQLTEGNEELKLPTFTAKFRITPVTIKPEACGVSENRAPPSDMLVRPQPLTLENVDESLRHMMDEAVNKLQGQFVWLEADISSKIFQLEIPQPNKESLWDQVDVALIPIYISILRVLSLSIPPYHRRGKLQQYALLAIIDRLARRASPNELEGYTVDATPLLKTFLSDQEPANCPNDIFDDPKYVEMFQKISGYFFPDIDITKPIDWDEIEKRSEQSIFSSKPTEERPGAIHILDPRKEISPVEVEHLKKLLQDPEIQEKIKALGFSRELTEAEQMQLLIRERCVERDGNSVYSDSYQHLHMQTRTATNYWYDNLTLSLPPTYRFAERMKILQKMDQIYDAIEVKVSKASATIGMLAGPLAFDVRKPLNAMVKFVKEVVIDSTLGMESDDENDPKIVSQAKLMAAAGSSVLQQVRKRPDRIGNHYKITDTRLQMISCERSDQVIRALEYFRNHKFALLEERNRERDKPSDVNANLQFRNAEPLKQDVINRDFWNHIFSPVALKQQLEDSPQSMQAIGEFLEELFQELLESPQHRKHFYLAVALSHKLSRFCQEWAPDQLSCMPDVNKYIAAFEELTGMSSECRILEVLAREGSLTTRQAQIALCRGIFAEPTSFLKDVTYESEWEVKRMFREAVYEELPEINEALETSEFRNDMIAAILKDRGVVIDNSQLSWKRVSPWEFTCGGWKVDLFSGFIGHERIVGGVDFVKLTAYSKAKFGIEGPVQLGSNGNIQTADGKFRFTVGNSAFLVQQHIGGKWFHHVGWSNLNDQERNSILKLIGREGNPGFDIWVASEGMNGKREAHIFDPVTHTSIAKFTLEVTPNEHDVYQLTCVRSRLNELHPVKTDSFAWALAPLSAFCSLAKTECWTAPGGNALAKLRFVPYDLTFTVKEEEEGKKAYSDGLLPGYFISQNQSHKGLQAFPSYLLLENQSQKKVLIPAGNWVSTLTWRLASQIGPLSQFMKSYLNDNVDRFDKTKSNTLYQFDLDQSGRLTSDKPENLIYLMITYLLQGNEAGAFAACDDFERVSKATPLPPGILNRLVPLGLFLLSKKGAARIRRRAVAAVEKNIQMFNVEQPRVDNVEKSPHDYALMNLAYLDLYLSEKEIDKRHRLSSDQEWFLFQALFRSARSLMLATNVPELASQWTQEAMEGIIENTLLTPSLRTRYRYLKKKYDHEESLTQQAIRLGTDVWRAPSSLLAVDQTVAQLKREAGVQQITAPQLSVVDDMYNGMINFPSCRNLDLVEMLMNCPPAEAVSSMNTFTFDRLTARSVIDHFPALYAIAKGDRGVELQTKLHQQLKFVVGGWDSQTGLIVRHLTTVCEYPRLFLDTAALVEALMAPQGRKDKITNFISNLVLKSDGLKVGAHVARAAGKMVFNAISSGIANRLRGSIPAHSFTRELMGQVAIGTARSALHYGSKFYHAVKGANSPTQEEPAPQERRYTTTFDSLVTLDEPFEAFFENCSRTVFVQVEGEEGLQFQGEESLWSVYRNLNDTVADLKLDLKRNEKELLNALNEGHHANVTMEDLKRYFVRGDINELPTTTLSPEVLQHLDRSLMRHYMRLTRYQQMKRACRILEAISQIDPSNEPKKYEAKLETLVNVLNGRRAWTVNGISGKLARLYVMFETINNTLLWKKPVDKMKKIIEKHKGEGVAELLMSLGKSFFMIPTLGAHDADGKRLVIHIWPSAMVETNVKQISAQCREIFHQAVNALRFSRHLGFSPQNYEAVNILLAKAKDSGETVHMTKQDSQAIELLFLDHIQRYLDTSNHDDRLSFSKLKQTLLMFLDEGKVIGDEAHELFNEREELNYPIGVATTLPVRYYDVMEECFRIMARNEVWMRHFKENTLKHIPDTYKDEIAKVMSCSPLLNITDEGAKKEFISFVCGQSQTIPQWILESPVYGEISVVKGLLCTLLPLFLKKEIRVDFGDAEGIRVAKPYQGNMSPQMQALIKQPFEAMCKTFLTYLHNGLTLAQTRELVEGLHHEAVDESKKHRRRIDETNAGRFVSATFPGTTLTALIADVKKGDTVIFKAMQRNPDCLFRFFKKFVRGDLLYWKESLRSDAQDFSAMFHERFFDTGTPYNDGTYPDDVAMIWEKGTSEEAAMILKSKCPSDGIHCLKATDAEKLVEEVLHKHFQKGSLFSSIIDGKPGFKGLGNRAVVKKMLDFVTVHRKGDIRAIDYFDKDSNGRDIQMTWEVGAAGPVPYETCRLPLEARLAYFDHRHGFAASIPQRSDGKGLVLVGDDHHLSDLFQEGFRMRGLKEFKRLQSQSGVGGQRVEFAMTAETRQRISGERLPTLDEIIAFARNNQIQAVKEMNYRAYKNKVFTCVRRHIFTKILREKSEKKMLALFSHFRHILVTQMEDDPRKLFGMIEKEENVEVALKMIRDGAYATIASSRYLSNEEKEEIKRRIEATRVPPMPTTVVVLNDGVKNSCDAFGDLQQEISVEQETQNEMESEQDTEVVADTARVSVPWFTEKEWPATIDVRVPLTHGTTMIHSVRDLLLKSPEKRLQQVAGSFDARLWFSNNFLPQHVGMMEGKVYIGTPGQRPLTEVLIQLTENGAAQEVVSVGCLSIKDSAIWRERLKLSAASGSGIKAVIYDISSRTIVGGDRNVDLKRLRENSALVDMELQLKFLNGDVEYRSHYHAPLRSWVSRNKRQQLQEAFEAIFRGRCISGTYADSDIAQALEGCGREL